MSDPPRLSRAEQRLAHMEQGMVLWSDGKLHAITRLSDPVVLGCYYRYVMQGTLRTTPTAAIHARMAAIFLAEIQRRGLQISGQRAYRAGLALPCCVAECSRVAHTVTGGKAYCDRHHVRTLLLKRLLDAKYRKRDAQRGKAQRESEAGMKRADRSREFGRNQKHKRYR